MSLVKYRKEEEPLAVISRLMSDDYFKNFFEKYFSNWSDARAMLMLMHAYVLIEDLMNDKSLTLGNEIIASNRVITVLKELLSDSSSRQMLVSSMSDYIARPDDNFRKIIEEKLSTQQQEN